MIGRVEGELAEVREGSVLVMVGGVGFEVLVSTVAADALAERVGSAVRFETLTYIEGNPAMGSLVPRLVGFVAHGDRVLYEQLLKVRGISMRKALRAMALPTAQLAAAIEAGDTRLLKGLPEIGAKSAEQIVRDLGGKLGALLEGAEAAVRAAPAALSTEQAMALEILVQWGEKAADAQRWLEQAAELDPAPASAEEFVKAAYRCKQGGGA